MDETLLNRLRRTLAGSAHRRETLRLSAAAVLGGITSGIAPGIAEARKKKKRCRKRLERCGDGKKCCNGSGPIKCQFVQEATKAQCDAILGRRCCGLDGASCDPVEQDCDCCGRAICREFEGGMFRCEDDPT